MRPRALLICAVAAILAAACGQPDPGQVSFSVTVPSDQALSPLADPRVTTLEVRDASAGEAVLGTASYDPRQRASLSLGPLPVLHGHDLRLLALGSAGQQVLGMAFTRNVDISYGSQQQYPFQLRRPLFFFGGNQKMVPPNPFPPAQAVLSPGQILFPQFQDESFLRVIDPNSGTPLLHAYDLQLEPGQALVASAGTADGQSLLVATLAGNLYLVDTLQLKAVGHVQVPSPQVQTVVIGPRDQPAVLLHYSVPPDMQQPGRVTFLKDIGALRNSDGSGMQTVEIGTGQAGPPLSAAYAPDGMVDVVLGPPPIVPGQPDCTMLGGADKSALLRFDPATGMAAGTATMLPYTTAVSYTAAGERVLAQPCTRAPGSKRMGQVVIQQKSGEDCVLPSPGTADVGGQSALVAVGRDDVADSPDDTTKAQGMARVLLPGACAWSQQSSFVLGDWLLPFSVTTSVDGNPLPGAVDVVFSPRDALVYRTVVAPDRSRALLAARITYEVNGLGLYATTDGTFNYECQLDWSGDTYHVMLLNLQTGAREQDWTVGLQNRACTTNLYQLDNNGQPIGPSKGSCLAECEGAGPLLNYQEGFIPNGLSALFGK